MKHHSDETQRLEVKQYFEGIKKYTQSIPGKRYPHQNRYIALLHLLTDSVSSLTRKRMEDESEHAAVRYSGFDAGNASQGWIEHTSLSPRNTVLPPAVEFYQNDVSSFTYCFFKNFYLTDYPFRKKGSSSWQRH